MCQAMQISSLKQCLYFFAEPALGLKSHMYYNEFTGMKGFFFSFKEMDFRRVMEQNQHSTTLVLCQKISFK